MEEAINEILKWYTFSVGGYLMKNLRTEKRPNWFLVADMKYLRDIAEKAYKQGYERAKADLAKDTTEVDVFDDWQYGKDPDHIPQPAIKYRNKDMKIGDKVKLLVIKD